MWALFKRNREDCSRFRDALESAAELLPQDLAAHAGSCEECRFARDEAFASRALLKALPRQAEAGPWLAPRVMAAIAAREVELRRSVEAWTFMPKLAAQLTWVSALALLLTSTWLVGRPVSAPARPVLTDLAGEPVIETTQAPANNDDVLLSLGEKVR